MKTMGVYGLARTSFTIIICGMIVLWGISAFGQEWTTEQKEVLKAMEADIEFFKKGDYEGLSALRHEDAIIWWSDQAKPFDKKSVMSEYKNWFDYDKPTKYEFKPLAVQIFSNVANVFYTYKFSGALSSESGRSMETFIKQDGKWLKISSFEASCTKLPPCQ